MTSDPFAAPPKRITAGSNHRLGVYDQCPRRAYYEFVTKELEQEPKTEALLIGIDKHKAIEDYIKGERDSHGMDLSEAVAHAIEFARRHVTDPGKFSAVEQQWGFDREFKQTDWFSPAVWWRVVADVVLVGKGKAMVMDWKTGHVYGAKHQKQITEQCHATLLRYPTLEAAEGAMVYLDAGRIGKKVIVTRNSMKPFETKLRGRLETMTNDVEFEAKAGYHCFQCPAGKQGVCPYRWETKNPDDYEENQG